jgi:hypothetical protein
VDQKDLDLGDQKLRNFMSFMRVKPQLVEEHDFFDGPFLSDQGKIFFAIPFVLSLLIIFTLVLSICFFYAPITF